MMRDVQLQAYTEAGLDVAAITSPRPEIAREVADMCAIPKVYSTVSQMLRDSEIAILDIAVPPDQPNVWFTPKWQKVWFPDAFLAPMSELIQAIASGKEPPTSGEDNLNTMALIEAGYRSLHERHAVSPSEISASSPVTRAP